MSWTSWSRHLCVSSSRRHAVPAAGIHYRFRVRVSHLSSCRFIFSAVSCACVSAIPFAGRCRLLLLTTVPSHAYGASGVHRLWMWRWLFSDVNKLRDDLKPDLFSNSGTGFIPGFRNGGKKAFIWMTSMSASHWYYLFHRRVAPRFYNWFRIWQYQTPFLKWYLQLYFLAERLILGLMVGVF
jgi:hypothetical protein